MIFMATSRFAGGREGKKREGHRDASSSIKG
jgi:hypothetical protein